MRFLALFVLALVGIAASAQNMPPVAAARAWLEPIDAGAYDDAWRAAAPHLQESITSERWRKALEGVRAPLGAVESRGNVAVEQRSELPGAPDGEYAIVRFMTRFAEKKRGQETVVLVRHDGRWRGDGYFIR